MTEQRKSATERGYGSAWRKARSVFLRQHPLCRMCEQHGHLKPAQVVDHVIPHKGDLTLFWDTANWQPLCKLHHDAAKQREEKRGAVQGCDAAGLPLDPGHHWARQ